MIMELVKISDKMEKLIDDLSKLRMMVREYAEKKANKSALYEKKLAIVIISLKNGKDYELDGNTVCNPQTTITKEIAKGICWKEKLESDEAEGLYKACVINIETIKSQLNGYQTIIKYLESN